jgi:4-carboxymuconolactone decarboxylase
MPRINTISDTEAGPRARMVFFFTRRALTSLSGQSPEGMLDPLRLYAHTPELLKGIAALEQATAKAARLDRRLRALAELKASTMVACEYCIDLGSQVARSWGLSDEEILALPAYDDSDRFDDLDKLVLRYAVGMSRTPADVPEGLVTALSEHLSNAQLVELTHVIAIENLRGRFNHALGVGASGFSDGMVCAVPERPAHVDIPRGQVTPGDGDPL